ncbi:MAG: tetratricopeptide repeat protein [Spirochaetes bacterium]|nr:tetratricopeptide repeat protein [Spirochaetota bacterium]
MSNGANKPAMNIITRSYKHGSIIYFEGDRSDVIYILKAGKVVLTSIKIDTGEELKENIKLGEFFGVKSAIGRYPREETAQTIGDTTVLVVSRADFEKMMIKNVSMVTKMLRVFSNQLRRITNMQREILGQSDGINPASELFKIGEYYFKSGNLQQAKYAFKRYLEHYPGTKFSELALQRINTIDTGGSNTDFSSDDSMENSKENVSSKRAESSVDLTDFSIDDSSDNENINIGSTHAPSKEMDDFFSDGDDGLLDDSGFGTTEQKSFIKQKDITEMFYEAVSLFSQERYKDALAIFQKILNIKTLKNESENKIFEKAHFEIGRCYLKINDFKEAVNYLSTMIKKFPKSDNVKNAFLHIGMAFEMAGRKDKATAYYDKVVSMEPNDSVTKQAQKRLKSIENTGKK